MDLITDHRKRDVVYERAPLLNDPSDLLGFQIGCRPAGEANKSGM